MSRLSHALLLSSFLTFSAHAETVQVGGEFAWENPKASADLSLRDTAFPKSSVAVTLFSPIDQARIDAIRSENALPSNKVLKIGVERNVATEAETHADALRWHAQADGSQTARLEVASPRAVALRVALDVTQLPAGAELRFVGNDAPDSVVAVATADEIAALRKDQPLYWSPITEGDTQTIEIYLPAGAESRWTRVSLRAVSHLFVSPTGTLIDAKIGESDDCEYDAKCLENPSDAYNNAKNSVARMLFQTGGSTAACTGTLLNDTDAGTQVPHFYSAAHCFSSQAEASTLATFWFYEATGCGSGQLDAAARQLNGGATILYANEPSDVLLVRLNAAPPAGAYYLGWDSSQLAVGTEIAVLHHPAGDVKKVSLGGVKGFGGSTIVSGNFIKVGYTDGTTEGGSSGSGLLTVANGELVLRGGLLGGSASCANTGELSNAANSDDFSRFDQAFPSLRAFLQPSSNPPINADLSGAWGAPNASGFGLSVTRGESGAYAINLYHYEQDSSSAWFLSSGQLSGNNYNATLYALSGPWFGITPYDPSKVSVRNAGTISVAFTSATTATMSFTIDGKTVTTALNKSKF